MERIGGDETESSGKNDGVGTHNSFQTQLTFHDSLAGHVDTHTNNRERSTEKRKWTRKKKTNRLKINGLQSHHKEKTYKKVGVGESSNRIRCGRE